jgi:myo-inositol 2-dehydrogenase / D-chiro-inositol 1-dehydrogenase
MGMTHVEAVAELCQGQAEISAVCSNNPEHVRKALEFAPKAKVFKSDVELIASPLDAIFVSTPNFSHVPLALQILKADKHLFLEKPCGITADECRQLEAATEKSDRMVMIGHELRYSPFFQKIKDLVAAGEIGQPHMVWCREFRGPLQKKTNDWIQDNHRSGGTLLDKNCHHFDLMNWWVGSRPRRVCAFGGNAVNRVLEGPDQAHDHATVSFEYANKVRGTLHLCLFALDFPKEDLEMGIIGENGLLQTRISTMEILQWKRGTRQSGPKVHTITAKSGLGWGSHLGTDEIHQEFVKCMLEKRLPLTSVRACLDASLVAIAAEESIRQGRIVEL